jgi:hypothetical protein
MRVAATLSLVLIASLAHAQLDAKPAWDDFRTQEAALETTTTQDCIAACKALESLARAAQHICEVAPDHCDEAKARLAAASYRVHATCPQCDVRGGGAAAPDGSAAGQTTNDTSVQAVSAESTHRGGCADCTTAGGTPDASVWLLLAALALLKKKKRRV